MCTLGVDPGMAGGARGEYQESMEVCTSHIDAVSRSAAIARKMIWMTHLLRGNGYGSNARGSKMVEAIRELGAIVNQKVKSMFS